MLKIYFGSDSIFMYGKISYVSEYFDGMYEQSWLSSNWGRQIIKEIDNSDYIDGEYIKSPVLGGISPRDLSSGCKALLILLNEDDVIVSGDRMGDNCFPLLLELAKERDLIITLAHWVTMKDFEPFEILDMRTDKILRTALEFADAYIDAE